jgi:rhodanese-related sulfurtransferase
MKAQELNLARTIIDVRSKAEFLSGNAIGAINIPLNEIEARSKEIADMDGDIILCCASGNRSGMAQQLLASKNIKTYNGGSWIAANNFQIG